MAEIVHRIAPSWQKSLRELITDPKVLFDRLKLDITYLPEAERAVKLFPLRVSEHYLQQIIPGNIEDPLLKQILPIGAEFTKKEGFCRDPLEESKTNPVPGLLHKYKSRVLLTVTQACAIHCRYCFRREFTYSENNPGRKGWDAIIQYIKNAPAVNEIIYSGGDPLTVNDAYLQSLTSELAKLPQLTRLRIHTRLPLLIPERVCDELLDWLTIHPNLKPILILHCNHPQEISIEVKNALKKLAAKGVTLLNQSVLLKGINDTCEILVKLSETLFEINVLPYYLHLLDRVNGVAHFEVADETAVQLMQQISAKLPGYLVPKLVREVAGEPTKTHILTVQ